MTLLELRRYAVRHGVSVHFSASGVGECLVNEHGVLQIPSLDRTPSFRMDSALPDVEKFTLRPVRTPAKSQTLSRQDFERIIAEPAGAASDREEQ
jgi:hypothetical protein